MPMMVVRSMESNPSSSASNIWLKFARVMQHRCHMRLTYRVTREVVERVLLGNSACSSYNSVHHRDKR